ncbi:hypothetical protein 23F_00063 [Ralstonia phage Gerry]|uniref:Uncharacterized protein n=1 Tax=Ralstonia phage Gerry TaxID=2759727 RepID=A0A7G5BAA0_9CAUD|nr:hypothetical protein KMC47_gp60 [Ralstonia phage Gerry]QMV33223.1 hypothetical protein 23F_00063 [Ralstonia phage Gerry]
MPRGAWIKRHAAAIYAEARDNPQFRQRLIAAALALALLVPSPWEMYRVFSAMAAASHQTVGHVIDTD